MLQVVVPEADEQFGEPGVNPMVWLRFVGPVSETVNACVDGETYRGPCRASRRLRRWMTIRKFSLAF
jgi:hypothetical protein